MMRTRTIQNIAVMLTIICMILPFGAVCRYVTVADTGMQHEVLKNFSYFNVQPFILSITESFKQLEIVSIESIAELLPFWFFNLSPFMCAVATVLCEMLMLVGFCFKKDYKILQISTLALTSAALILSLIPLVFYGLKFYNMTTMAVSYLLLCTLVLGIHRLTGKVYTVPKDEEEEEPEIQ